MKENTSLHPGTKHETTVHRKSKTNAQRKYVNLLHSGFKIKNASYSAQWER